MISRWSANEPKEAPYYVTEIRNVMWGEILEFIYGENISISNDDRDTFGHYFAKAEFDWASRRGWHYIKDDNASKETWEIVFVDIIEHLIHKKMGLTLNLNKPSPDQETEWIYNEIPINKDLVDWFKIEDIEGMVPEKDIHFLNDYWKYLYEQVHETIPTYAKEFVLHSPKIRPASSNSLMYYYALSDDGTKVMHWVTGTEIHTDAYDIIRDYAEKEGYAAWNVFPYEEEHEFYVVFYDDNTTVHGDKNIRDIIKWWLDKEKKIGIPEYAREFKLSSGVTWDFDDDDDDDYNYVLIQYGHKTERIGTAYIIDRYLTDYLGYDYTDWYTWGPKGGIMVSVQNEHGHTLKSDIDLIDTIEYYISVRTQEQIPKFAEEFVLHSQDSSVSATPKHRNIQKILHADNIIEWQDQEWGDIVSYRKIDSDPPHTYYGVITNIDGPFGIYGIWDDEKWKAVGRFRDMPIEVLEKNGTWHDATPEFIAKYGQRAHHTGFMTADNAEFRILGHVDNSVPTFAEEFVLHANPPSINPSTLSIINDISKIADEVKTNLKPYIPNDVWEKYKDRPMTVISEPLTAGWHYAVSIGEKKSPMTPLMINYPAMLESLALKSGGIPAPDENTKWGGIEINKSKKLRDDYGIRTIGNIPAFARDIEDLEQYWRFLLYLSYRALPIPSFAPEFVLHAPDVYEKITGLVKEMWDNIDHGPYEEYADRNFEVSKHFDDWFVNMPMEIPENAAAAEASIIAADTNLIPAYIEMQALSAGGIPLVNETTNVSKGKKPLAMNKKFRDEHGILTFPGGQSNWIQAFAPSIDVLLEYWTTLHEFIIREKVPTFSDEFVLHADEDRDAVWYAKEIADRFKDEMLAVARNITDADDMMPYPDMRIARDWTTFPDGRKHDFYFIFNEGAPNVNSFGAIVEYIAHLRLGLDRTEHTDLSNLPIGISYNKELRENFGISGPKPRTYTPTNIEGAASSEKSLTKYWKHLYDRITNPVPTFAEKFILHAADDKGRFRIFYDNIEYLDNGVRVHTLEGDDAGFFFDWPILKYSMANNLLSLECSSTQTSYMDVECFDEDGDNVGMFNMKDNMEEFLKLYNMYPMVSYIPTHVEEFIL